MKAMIRVEGLSVAYKRRGGSVMAVQELSFAVAAGECVGFIGANGAGKSTTIKTLMGFTYANRGTVEVCGQPAGTPEGRRSVGYLPEVALYYPFMKAGEILELYGMLSGMSRAAVRARTAGILDRVGLGGHANDLLRTFSKGMQQRLGIAQALIAEPELLILDEVSSGLDPLGRYDLRGLLHDLNREGRTIFFSSHELTEVESLCDRVLLIHRGRLLREVSREALKTIGRERSLESFFIDEVRGGDRSP